MAPSAETFERAIRANPDDVAQWRVYADWLVDQDDPRGELMQVQLDLEGELADDARKALTAREAALVKAHAAAWLGPLAAPLGPTERRWEQREARFERGMLTGILTTTPDAEFVTALRNAGAARLRWLRELRLLEHFPLEDLDENVSEPGLENAYEPIAFLPFEDLGALRVLQLGGREPDRCHSQGEQVAEVLHRLPALRELRCEAHQVDVRLLFATPVPLRRLTVNHVHDYPLDVLAQNQAMTELEVLECWPHALEYGDEPYIDLADVEALAASPYLGALRDLTLKSGSFGDAGIGALVRSGMLARLTHLDLTHGMVTDAGAALLAAHGKHLQSLSLRANCLTEVGVGQLAAAGVGSLDTSEQAAPDDDDHPFSWYGDIE